MAAAKTKLTGKTKGKNKAVKQTAVEKPIPPGARVVTYVIDTRASKGGDKLSMPYAYSIDDGFSSPFDKGVERASGNRGAIRIVVLPEQLTKDVTIKLYLNSDARPGAGFRANPVYPVVLKKGEDHHVRVNIVEKLKKHDHKPVLGDATDDKKTNTKVYPVWLTGDIWMKVSHKYTPAEAQAIVNLHGKKDAPDVVRKAVLAVYSVLPEDQGLTLDLEADDGSKRTIIVAFQDAKSSNPKDNINSGYTLRGEGLTRVHPAAFLALLTALVDCGLDYAYVSSNWRPCLGSIAHRAGFGLDVARIDLLDLNRSQLEGAATVPDYDDEVQAAKAQFDAAVKAADERAERRAKKRNKASAPNAPAQRPRPKFRPPAIHGNVTEEERKRYQVFAHARSEADKAKKAMAEASALRAKSTGEEKEAAQAAYDEAKADHAAWTLRQNKAFNQWYDLGDAQEPYLIYSFRERLAHHPGVRQLFDPWVMIQNVMHGDAEPKKLPNTLKGGNENLHKNHLHITAREPALDVEAPPGKC